MDIGLKLLKMCAWTEHHAAQGPQAAPVLVDRCCEGQCLPLHSLLSWVAEKPRKRFIIAALSRPKSSLNSNPIGFFIHVFFQFPSCLSPPCEGII